MAVKVAINGFGRIGRLAFRQMFGAVGGARCSGDDGIFCCQSLLIYRVNDGL